MSRWAHWSSGTEEKKLGFSSFQLIAEMGQPVQGDPDQIIQQNGWQHRGYGYYVDASGQTVARVMDGQLYMVNSEPNEVDKQIDTGNPTNAASGMKPADRARSMGLQSNGRGGYIDPKTGQTVARTVNNELVFYDQRPGGGAVSDGAGGQKIAQDTPSWQDPVTGLVVTPPAKPESAQEIAAIPDPIPAQSPSGYNKFIQQKKLLSYAQHKQEYEQQQADLAANQEYEAAMEPYQSGEASKLWLMKFMKKIDAAMADPEKSEMAENALLKLQSSAAMYSQLLNKSNPEDLPEVQETLSRYIISSAKGLDVKAAHFGAKLDSIAQQQRSEYQDFQKSLEEGDPNVDQVEGERVVFTLDKRPPTEDMSQEDGALVFNAASEVGQDFDTMPTSMMGIEWDSFEDTEDKEANKLTAMDALKTWRQKVLPNLSPGTILYNVPLEGGRDGNQRERIYKLAGFGDVDSIGDTNMQFGLVVHDENGQPKVVPVGGEDSSRINEAYLTFLDMKLNTSHINTLYEHLFNGL
jgi:hypothetical protein